MRDIYEVSDEFDAISGLMDDPLASEEDFTSQLELAARPSENAESVRALAISLASVIRNADGLVSIIGIEEDRLKKRREVLERRSKAANEYLLYLLETAGIKEVEDSRFRLKVTRNPVSVEIVDRSKIPDEFFREKVTVEREPDKVAIREAYREGILVDGTSVIRKKRVIIR